ncbi:hypothetical protein BCU68_11595 [Vibrio sp. 10N.286.49.B3]|uniref:glycine zipper 2TM domain-containing protein n=1 Tax=Vibrio sp. 10N.286.49.B3 TaxID=1880855 RepID=UPI000C863156|nr:glycine zipper 2TM domain-containing protein [Vibrio sp. 10N.286.49.B3]PMH44788.1 hypothetical protein BCU68_11595 [Vibrio sp. 10N.286.49.B3]
MVNNIRNISILVICLMMLGCASNPVTVIDKRYGVIKQEKKLHVNTKSGLATIGGATAGGLIGNQIGGGTGKVLATIGGAVIGGTSARKVTEKQEINFEYLVLMSDGERFILETKKNRKKIGSRVLVERLSNGRERVFVL